MKAGGSYVSEDVTIPEGSYYISMKQPLARLISELLEPESQDSLFTWGFFNREILQQWTDRPGKYPVYRYHGEEKNFITIQE